MIRRHLFPFLLLGPIALIGQNHPNFTGTWKLNEAPGGGSPTAVHDTVFQIEHKDPAFHYTATGKRGMFPFTESYDFTTDGKPPADASKLAASGRWDGAVLVMAYVKGGQPIARFEFRLSPDGKQMFRQGEFANRQIRESYTRQ